MEIQSELKSLYSLFLLTMIIIIGTFWIPVVTADQISDFKGVADEYTLITTWGEGPYNDDGQLNYPEGIAVDSSGFVYIADTFNNRIQKFDNQGNFIKNWVLYDDLENDLLPVDIAIDNSDTIYISVTPFLSSEKTQKIQKYDVSGNFLGEWEPSQALSSFNQRKICVDDVGNLFVMGQYSNESGKWEEIVLKFDTNGGFLKNLSLKGSVGVDNQGYIYSGKNGEIQKFDGNGNFLTNWTLYEEYPGNWYFFISNLKVDETNNIWVIGTHNIQVYNNEGIFIKKFDLVDYSTPWSLAFDSSGNFFVLDVTFQQVQKYDSNGNFLTRWGSDGNGRILFPVGIAVDGEGNVYVSDLGKDSVQKFTNEGEYVAKWGSIGNGDGQFNDPRGITIDKEGNIYVTDSENQRVQKFDKNGNFVLKWGSPGPGYIEGNFRRPIDIDIDSNENVYVIDQAGGWIQKFDEFGNFLDMLGDNWWIKGIAIDSQDIIYVISQKCTIDKINSSGYLIDTISFDPYSTHISGIATDEQGCVYTINNGKSSLLKIKNGEIVSSTPIPSLIGYITSIQTGIDIDSNGNVFIADGERVYKFSPKDPSNSLPPASVTNLHNTTTTYNSITWVWTDPSSANFDKVMIYLNGQYQTDILKGVQSFTASTLIPATSYEIGTHTVGTNGVVNSYWVNHTAITAPEIVVDIPDIASLNPISITSGSDGFTLEITGTNFIYGAKVLWDGQERATVFVSSNELTTNILDSDIDTSGVYIVKVMNPDGSISDEFTFTVLETIPITYPKVDTFTVSPLSGSVGQKFTISGNVSAGKGATIQRVELWRNSGDPLNQDDWKEMNPPDTSLQGLTNGSYSFENTPESSGEYWYGIHVVDTNGWAHEGGGNDLNDGKPIMVTVYQDPSSDGAKLVTDQVGLIGRTTAILRGHIENPIPGVIYDVCFRYESYSTPKIKIGDFAVTSDNPNYEYQLNNLEPGKTYHYRAVHIDSEGLTNPNDIDAINFESFSTISAEIDSKIIAYLDELIPNENSEYFNKEWKITPEQYKLMILAKIWGEGGKQGFSAHSGVEGADRVTHPDVKFYFSSGIGPFQLDWGGEPDSWENWPTVEKLNWQNALKSTLKIHKSDVKNKEISTLDDMRLGVRNRWYAYYKTDETTPPLGKYEVNWKSVTGTEWDSVKDSNRDNSNLLTHSLQTYSIICDSNKIDWTDYSEVVQPLGKLNWDIREGDKLKNWDGEPIIYDKNLDSWLIHAKGVGFEQKYLYGLDTEKHIEIWAYFNKNDKEHHLKSIFIRDYRIGLRKYALPINSNSKTLSHDVIKMTNDHPLIYIIYCPVDAELTDPDGLIITKDHNEIQNATYERKVVDEEGNSDIVITISKPKIGNYSLNVIPFEEANPNDFVSIHLVDGLYTFENPLILENNTKISELSPISYLYYSLPMRSDLIPHANFTWIRDFIPNTLNYIDTSNGNITTRHWSFGDGTFAENVTEVTHTYTAPGNYTVMLTVSGPDGEDSASQIVNVMSMLVPTSTITNLHNTTYQQTSITWGWTDPMSPDFDYVMVYLDGVFQDNVTQGVQSFTASSLSPSTAYTIGTRTVGTTGLVNETWINDTATTAPDPGSIILPPEADFNANITSGNTPLTVQFNDASTGTITSYAWDFENDGTIDSTTKDPIHSYGNPGTYTVNLTVTGPGGTDSEVRTNYITVIEPPESIAAQFTASPLSGNRPLVVRFIDQSAGLITSREWDFNNDGKVDSTLKDPTYFYISPGNYTVRLTVIGPDGMDEEIKEGYISVGKIQFGFMTGQKAPMPRFTQDNLFGSPPLTVQFTDQTQNNPETHLWSFGDGTTSSEKNPVHTYNFPGLYRVRLTVSNEMGSRSASGFVYVRGIRILG